jgi:hypothetical protein
MIFTISAQGIFVTKYWVIGRTLQSLSSNLPVDKHLTLKAYSIFGSVLLFSLLGSVILVGLGCQKEDSPRSATSLALTMLAVFILVILLLDALRLMRGSLSQDLDPKMMIVLFGSGLSFLVAEIVEVCLLFVKNINTV